MIDKKTIKENREKITELLRETKRKGIEDLVDFLDESDFFTAPASTMYHGNFEGGLAAHSYAVYEEFRQRVEHYGLNVPEDSVAISSICHDFCKINQYVPNKLKSGNLSESKPYKVEDNFPIGHGEKSVYLVQKYIDLTEQEAMIIRWHMGKSDRSWEDYEDKIVKNFPEVVIFNHTDIEVPLIKKL